MQKEDSEETAILTLVLKAERAKAKETDKAAERSDGEMAKVHFQGFRNRLSSKLDRLIRRRRKPKLMPQLKGSAAKRLVTLERTHTQLLEYLYGANALAIVLKGDALRYNNPLSLAYYQSSIDILIDINNILEGKHIKTLQETIRESRRHWQQQKAEEKEKAAAEGEEDGSGSKHKEEERRTDTPMDDRVGYG